MDIISEIGLNHGGDLNKAIEMIRISKECNCSTVKFQFYYPEILCTDRNCFDSYKLLDKIKMRPQWIPILADECRRHRIEFLVTPFCKYSVEQIAPYVSRFKIASPEACNLEFV
jgi:sialic acid synthase SpsE